MKRLLFLLALVLLAAPVTGEATQETWSVDNFPEGANTRIFSATHSYNDASKSNADPFWVSAAAWSDSEATEPISPDAHWRMDLDIVGTTPESQGSKDATLTEEATITEDGKILAALNLSATDAGASVPDDALWDSNSFSWAFWVKPDEGRSGTGQRFISHRTGDVTGYSLTQVVTGPSTGLVAVNLCSVVCNSYFSTNTIPDAAWTHVGITYHQPTAILSIYLNGALDSSHGSATDPANDLGLLWFGRSESNGAQYQGLLDDVRFYASSLDASELGSIFLLSRPSFPFVTTISPTGCSVVDEAESTGGQYQHSKAWLLQPDTDSETCTWVGNLQYYDPGFGIAPAVNLYMTGSVDVKPAASTNYTYWLAYALLIGAAVWLWRNDAALPAFIVWLAFINELVPVIDRVLLLALFGVAIIIQSYWAPVTTRAKEWLGSGPNG